LPLPPPRSTLFPYTTLFRSLRDLDAEIQRKGRKPEQYRRTGYLGGFTLCHETLLRNGRHQKCRVAVHDALTRFCQRLRRAAGRRDRKSTRLNSSHVKISYAV